MSDHIPDKFEVDYDTPTLFITRCPNCGRITERSDRPGEASRICSPCNRLMGVTPVSNQGASALWPDRGMAASGGRGGDEQ